MSEIQNPNLEDVTSTPALDTPEVVESTDASSSAPGEKSSRDSRSQKGDRPRGNRRDGGMREEEKEFKEEMLSIDRVTRVTAGGRQIRFRASIVIGDGKGRIGLGTGKAGEVQVAIEKAIRDAKKHLITFPIVNGTIPHDVAVNFKSSGLYIHPAHPGTGIIAGGAVRKIFSVSGIKDVIAKQHGAPNMITNARVTLKALQSLKPVALNSVFSTKKPSSETPVKSESTPSEASPSKVTPAKKAPAKKKAE
jgi:small subunit ribosomal protein S5